MCYEWFIFPFCPTQFFLSTLCKSPKVSVLFFPLKPPDIATEAIYIYITRSAAQSVTLMVKALTFTWV